MSPAANTLGTFVVAAGEVGAGLGVAAGILLDAKALQDGGHRVHEAHGQQHEVGLVGSFSVPATSTSLPSLNSTCTVFNPVTLPFFPVNSLVEMANSRTQPSSWLELVRSLSGQ
jgi:hypothetical protein